ncbi:MAG: cupin domain-containing protein [Bacillota bacterium]
MLNQKLPFVPSLICPKVRGPRQLTAQWNHPDWADLPERSLALSSGHGQGSLATHFRLCWDGDYLYLIFRCQDPRVAATFTERDQPLYEEEVVELFIAPGDDPHRYFEFELSPKGVVFDARVDNPSGRASMHVDPSWDCQGLKTAVSVADDHWTAEMAIPLAELTKWCGSAAKADEADRRPWRSTAGRAVADQESWWINLYRIERQPQEEYYAWSPTFREPADFHCPECFGHLILAREEAEKPEVIAPLAEAAQILQPWSPRDLTTVNDTIVRVAVFEGFFHWHLHHQQDEMFYVLEGQIAIETEAGVIPLDAGQGVVIPRGMMHRPHALKRAVVLLIEPKETVSRGDAVARHQTPDTRH